MLSCVMLLWVYIHTGQAWKICLATVGYTLRVTGVCLVGTSSPSANPISNSPLFVVMSFVSFLHSIVKFASLIKASCIVTSHKHLIHLSTLHQHSKYGNDCDVTPSVYPHRASLKKYAYICLPTVARYIFQACPVWIYTQSNITSIIFAWVHYTNTEKN
jgi:hypothetical protein